ncbi:MAG: hypothetical protein Q9219_002044 [cf. Caloplaca sp. 3 TL-2023]
MPSLLQVDNNGNGGLDDDLGEFLLIDDLFKARAKDKIQKPLIAFPKSERGVSDFEFFNGRDLDRFIENAARHYGQVGLRVTEYSRVAVLGPTNIEWVTTVFALLRAGFAVVALSPRISAQAISNLLSETQCESIVCADSSQILQNLDQVREHKDVQTIPILSRNWFDRSSVGTFTPIRNIDRAREAERTVMIMHSSGSTGLPKPIYINHKRYTQFHQASSGTKEFMTLPLWVACNGIA